MWGIFTELYLLYLDFLHTSLTESGRNCYASYSGDPRSLNPCRRRTDRRKRGFQARPYVTFLSGPAAENSFGGPVTGPARAANSSIETS